jgi:fructokinase
LEGLASGTAILQRCGVPLAQLPAEHPMWAIEADYLAQLCAVLILTTSPERIVLGGGVMQSAGLIGRLIEPLATYLAGYPAGMADRSSLAQRLVPPGLDGRSGIVGALAMAETELSRVRREGVRPPP